MTEPTADDELPPYLRDEPPLVDPEPAEPPKAAVVQMPGTHRKAGPAKGQPRKSRLDLDRIQREYAANVLTVREIAERHACSNGRVVQLAKQYGWTRDTRAQARQQAAVLVNNPDLIERIKHEARLNSTENAAAVMALIRTGHRSLILEHREVLAGLLAEVRAAAKGEDFQATLDRLERESDPDKKVEFARAAINRVLTLPSRIYGIKKLSDAAKNIIALERQAFDLDAAEAAPTPPPKDTSVSNAEVFAWLSQVKDAAR